MSSRDLTIRRGKLPHWELTGAVYFITFSTYKRNKLCNQAKDIVFNAFKFLDKKKYTLDQVVVMDDHCHSLLTPLQVDRKDIKLTSIMHSIKSYSAVKISKELGYQNHKIWERESFDRIVRSDEEYQKFYNYIAQNPVRSEVVGNVKDYVWYYSRK